MVELVKYKTIGRRKESIARVNLFPGKGNILVNKKEFIKYFPRETDRLLILQPLLSTNNLNKFDIFANIRGGGISGQAGALRLGIARAIGLADPTTHATLRKEGFLRRDPRMKERKKFGQKGARKRFQWTKR